MPTPHPSGRLRGIPDKHKAGHLITPVRIRDAVIKPPFRIYNVIKILCVSTGREIRTYDNIRILRRGCYPATLVYDRAIISTIGAPWRCRLRPIIRSYRFLQTFNSYGSRSAIWIDLIRHQAQHLIEARSLRSPSIVLRERAIGAFR